jgi:hypothetical protein
MSQQKMVSPTVAAIDRSKLAEVTGGYSYGQACRDGAIAGGLAGAFGGPLVSIAGLIGGCLGGLGANAISRNL